MEMLISEYNKTQPNVKLVGSYDSSGTLMTQIEEGASCDVFFSAAAKQMDQLEGENLLVEGTRHNIVNNQVCVVTYEGSNTEVTGLEDLNIDPERALQYYKEANHLNGKYCTMCGPNFLCHAHQPTTERL